MTSEELTSLKKVRPEDCAKYLQGEYATHELRLLARAGLCPFITAERKPGSERWTYHVNVGTLIKYKAGDIKPMRAARI